ncbi:MAG: energy transducer TonB [Elusimicrobia bacterium]|nr:energy transducer TonB [Elusimicrobiota bacterium]
MGTFLQVKAPRFFPAVFSLAAHLFLWGAARFLLASPKQPVLIAELDLSMAQPAAVSGAAAARRSQAAPVPAALAPALKDAPISTQPEPIAEEPAAAVPASPASQFPEEPAGGGTSGPEGRENAQATGAGGEGAGALAAYLALVRETVAQEKEYPSFAKQLKLEGTSVVRAVITPDGALKEVSLGSSSGHKALDRSALASVRRAAPFRPGPGAVPLTVEIPITFRIN